MTGCIALFIVLMASVASAQTAPGERIDTVLTPGMTVWVTDTSGREQKTRVLDVSAETITTGTDAGTRSLRTTDIARVRARRSDSVLNGALIGAGSALAMAVFMCRLTEPSEVCWHNKSEIVRVGAVGAGIGIGVDALIRGRKTIYAAPVIARGRQGVQLAFSF